LSGQLRKVKKTGSQPLGLSFKGFIKILLYKDLVEVCCSSTVFPRIKAAAIWRISIDEQKGAERIVSQLESEESRES
jgi:hypothetical protein